MKRAAFLLLLTSAVSAQAQEARELCTDRPGLGTPPCTVAPGGVVVEVGVGEWTRDRTDAARTDTFVAGDALVRIGIAEYAEVQAGWAAFGHTRERDRASDAVDSNTGVGDVTLALRRNLANPNGSDTSIAVMPYVSLPTGGGAIGAGDWSAGLIVPMSHEVTDGLTVTLSPEVDAAVDEDRSGRHLAYGGVAGLSIDLSDTLSGSGELLLMRDRDPGGHATMAQAGLSLAWQPARDLQIDFGGNIGLAHASPDIVAYAGIARRF